MAGRTDRRRNGKLSTAVRGYGGIHQSYRRQLKPFVDAGVVRCARGSGCLEAEVVDGVRVGGLIRPGQEWHLGHVDGSGKRLYSGPEHAQCNLSAGGREGAAKRHGGRRSRRW